MAKVPTLEGTDMYSLDWSYGFLTVKHFYFHVVADVEKIEPCRGVSNNDPHHFHGAPEQLQELKWQKEDTKLAASHEFDSRCIRHSKNDCDGGTHRERRERERERKE